MFLFTLTHGHFLYHLLVNTETQEIKTNLSLIGRQRMRDTRLVGMEL